jgi:hypothetical protein
MAEATVASDPDGYLALFDLIETHGASRACVVGGTGGYETGLARFLTKAGELIIELDLAWTSRSSPS